jgi:hypothetical protein
MRLYTVATTQNSHAEPLSASRWRSWGRHGHLLGSSFGSFKRRRYRLSTGSVGWILYSKAIHMYVKYYTIYCLAHVSGAWLSARYLAALGSKS